MQIAGLQKLTLLDYPETVACTVFLAGCNFRCPFCHNAALVTEKSDPVMSSEELLSFLKKRQGVLEGVAITGGEPLLYNELPCLLKQIKNLGYKIKLDTNGSKPEALQALIDQKLVDRVAMDIKASPEMYSKAVGINNYDLTAVTTSKNILLDSSIEYEFRTTVVKGIHTVESMIELAKWIKGAKEYYLQQFKDSGNLISADGLSAYTTEEMKQIADSVKQYVPTVKLRGI